MLGHSKITIDKTGENNPRVEPKSAIKSKPGNELREEFRKYSQTGH